MVTLHQANLNITKENGEFTLRYLNKNKTYFEKIKKHLPIVTTSEALLKKWT